MRPIAYLSIVSLLMACAADRIQTSTDGPTPLFTRILIVSKITHTTPNYLNRYVELFPTAYTVCTVDAGPLVFGNPDSLIQAKIRQCNSQVVLTLNEAQNYQGRVGKTSYNVNDMLLELKTLPDQKPFWKGITVVGALYDDSLNPRWVVKQLLTDGIITGKMPSQQYAPYQR